MGSDGRLMNLESAVNRQGERISRLEVKVNIAAWVMGAILISCLSTLALTLFH